MTFAHPWNLLAGAVAAAFFVALLLRAWRASERSAMRYSNLAFMLGAVRANAWPLRLLRAAGALALLLLVLAGAGPHLRAAVPVRDGAVVLCVDTSGSMSATDVAPTRAQAAAAAMRDFLQAVPAGVAVGIVSFSSGADVLIDPTRNREAVANAIAQVPAPNGATAIGDALLLAGRMLPPRGHRVVVLITDGENNAGSDPLAAAQALGSQGIRLYTIGIGTNSGALVPGTLQEAGIDEDALRAYAAAANGTYSRANDAAALRGALAQLGRTVAFQTQRVDASLAMAFSGAALLGLVVLGACAAGRFP